MEEKTSIPILLVSTDMMDKINNAIQNESKNTTEIEQRVILQALERLMKLVDQQQQIIIQPDNNNTVQTNNNNFMIRKYANLNHLNTKKRSSNNENHIDFNEHLGFTTRMNQILCNNDEIVLTTTTTNNNHKRCKTTIMVNSNIAAMMTNNNNNIVESLEELNSDFLQIEAEEKLIVDCIISNDEQQQQKSTIINSKDDPVSALTAVSWPRRSTQ
jgi:hypothetical protein